MSSVWEVSENIRRLAAIMHTVPIMIADVHGPNPMFIEELLVKRGQMRSGESIKDAIIRNYGESTFKKCEALLGVCPFENETKGDSDEK